jgi:hypothetical protein
MKAICEITGKPINKCKYTPIQGSEFRSEYEPNSIGHAESCNECGEIRFINRETNQDA